MTKARYKPGSKALAPEGCDDCGLNYCHCIEDIPPDAGLVEREAIARLVDPIAFRDVGDYEDHPRIQHALKKADAILALLSARAGAGEPVACWRIHNKRGWKSQWQDGAPPSYQELDCDPSTIERAYFATPAPSGRDPATIATVQFIRRADGGLRVCSDDLPGLILSGPDADAVAADVWPAIQALAVLTEDGETL